MSFKSRLPVYEEETFSSKESSVQKHRYRGGQLGVRGCLICIATNHVDITLRCTLHKIINEKGVRNPRNDGVIILPWPRPFERFAKRGEKLVTVSLEQLIVHCKRLLQTRNIVSLAHSHGVHFHSHFIRRLTSNYPLLIHVFPFFLSFPSKWSLHYDAVRL